MRSVFAKIIDIISLASVLFILAFAWIRFYTKNMHLSLILASIISLTITALFNILLHKKEAKKTLDKKEKTALENFRLNLLCAPNDEIMCFFSEILSKYKILKKTQKYIITKYYSSQNEDLNLHTTLNYVLFDKNDVVLNDIYPIIKTATKNKIDVIKIYSTNFSDETKNFVKTIQNKNIELIDYVKIFNIYSSNCKIIQQVSFKKSKATITELLNFAKNPKRAKNYLLSGFIVLATSLLVPFKIYYLILGSLLCILAFVIKIVPIIKKEKSL